MDRRWSAWQMLWTCVIPPGLQQSFRGPVLKGRSCAGGLARFTEVVRRDCLNCSGWLDSEGQGWKMPDCER